MKNYWWGGIKKICRVACQDTTCGASLCIMKLSDECSDGKEEIYMSWRRDGLLLAAGGLAGLVLAAILEEDGRKETEEERDGLEILADFVREQAQWAMDESVTEEEREQVYARIKEMVAKYQADLGDLGEEIIAEMREKAAGTPGKEEMKEELDRMVREFKVRTDRF